MFDFIDLGGTTPPDEPCAQLGSTDYDYHTRAKLEAKLFIGQLRRLFGNEPPGARLTIKSHPHDFGDYFTVVCRYAVDNPDAAAYAQRCDEELPQAWDDLARDQLPTLNKEGGIHV